MTQRSKLNLGAVAKNILPLLPHPWIGLKLMALEGEKWLFNMLNPQAASGKARAIRQVSIRITDVCNLRCHTCGQWGDHGFLHGRSLAELKKEEVTPERYLEVFADLVAHGHRPLIYLWGGEPMLYEGTLPIIRGAAHLGLPTSIATNGTRVAARARELVEAPLFLLQMSIDGHTAATHNRARPAAGNADNFADINKALAEVHKARRARRTNLPLIASLTTISRENYRHLIDIYETFRDRVDLAVFYLSWWIDEESAKAHDRDFLRRFGFKPQCPWGWLGDWRPDDFQELNRQLNLLQERSQPWSAPPVVMIPSILGEENLRTYYTNHRERFGYDQCVSIFQVVEIDSNGDLSPCRDYHDYVVGNIKEHTISELWNSERYKAFRKSLATEGLMPVCSRCCGLMGY
jgi:radical SAM protein with 4Fe4S-binding SPASM domain|uniref:Radical SAM protein n=1 Tax=Desulfobacca acetoxidans TaxID=60893 RepID=A0A7V6A2G7_9BACT